jgi:hypothetical protein
MQRYKINLTVCQFFSWLQLIGLLFPDDLKKIGLFAPRNPDCLGGHESEWLIIDDGADA